MEEVAGCRIDKEREGSNCEWRTESSCRDRSFRGDPEIGVKKEEESELKEIEQLRDEKTRRITVGRD